MMKGVAAKEFAVSKHRFLCLLAWFVAACGSGANIGTDGVGSETNWLAACEVDEDCEVGACHCGVCTRTCQDDEQCSAVAHAECIAPELLGDCDTVPRKPICATEGALEDANEGFSFGARAREVDGGSEPDADHTSDDDMDPIGDLDATPPSDDDTVATSDDVEASPSGIPDAGPSAPGAPTADPTKVDLLLVVDNSVSMDDEQGFLADQVLELTWQLVHPPCIAEDGSTVGFSGHPETDESPEECPEGSVRSHLPVEDLHVGTITTSLGGYGSETDCLDATRGQVDNAHLLGTSPSSESEVGFLRYCSERRAEAGDCEAANDALSSAADIWLAGVLGCGWEASLESWYRFLVEPEPWTRIVRQNCPGTGDGQGMCNGPELDADGNVLVDQALLDERNAFLRPDSVLIILMLSDENDCSFRADGQSWRLAQTYQLDEFGSPSPNHAYRGSAACSNDPNGACCVSCSSAPPEGCPTTLDQSGSIVSAGCEAPLYPTADELAAIGSSEPSRDAANLRCFHQKERFGVDYLYPVERYSRALSSAELCPASPSLDPAECAAAAVIENPLFASRSPADVIVAGLLGAPWEDLAVDPTGADPLVYRSASRSSDEGIDWSWLIGEREPAIGIVRPADPLMVESIEARSGTQPSTGADLSNEWNIETADDLQYACTFDFAVSRQCPSLGDLGRPGLIPCECTFYGDARFENPLCRSSDGTYGLTQHRGSAYPATRQLQVLYDLSEQAVVASVCPKEARDTLAADYGYRPAMNAIQRKLGERSGP